MCSEGYSTWFVRMCVCYHVFCHHAQQDWQIAIPTGSAHTALHLPPPSTSFCFTYHCLPLSLLSSLSTSPLSLPPSSSPSPLSLSPSLKSFKAQSSNSDPLSKKSASYASPQEVCKFITELGISRVSCHYIISLL